MSYTLPVFFSGMALFISNPDISIHYLHTAASAADYSLHATLTVQDVFQVTKQLHLSYHPPQSPPQSPYHISATPDASLKLTNLLRDLNPEHLLRLHYSHSVHRVVDPTCYIPCNALLPPTVSFPSCNLSPSLWFYLCSLLSLSTMHCFLPASEQYFDVFFCISC